MPSDPTVWLVLIISVALVTFAAIWFGRSFGLSWKDFKLRVTKRTPENGNNISVAGRAKIKDSKVGDIAGVIADDLSALPDSSKSINVLDEGTIENSNVRDIVGIKQPDTPPRNGK